MQDDTLVSSQSAGHLAVSPSLASEGFSSGEMIALRGKQNLPS